MNTRGPGILSENSCCDFLVCVSLANLCLLRIWGAILDGDKAVYFATASYSSIDYIAVLLNLSLLTTFFYAGLRLARIFVSRFVRSIFELAFLAAFMPLFDFVRRYCGVSYVIFLKHGILTFSIYAALATVLLFIVRKRLCRVGYVLLLYVSPFALLTIAQAAYLLARSSFPAADMMVAGNVHGASKPAKGPRVIWILFDEWDEAATFLHRPKGITLRNIDAFSKAALVASNAYPPGGNTEISIPSLLTGQYLLEVKPQGFGKLMIRTIRDSRLRDFRDTENLFTLFSTLRGGLAVAGWFHPYSQLVPPGLNIAVLSEPVAQLQGFRGVGIMDSMYMQARFSFAPFKAETACLSSFSRIHTFALDAIGDPSVRVLYLHYNIPHYPGIYDPRSGQLSLRFESADKSYFDNLQLVDRVIGEDLARLDATGLRESTTLILSSDHWRRDSQLVDGLRDHRIPIMIQFPGERKAMVFEPRINSVHTLQIIRGVMSGALDGQSTLVNFLKSYQTGVEYRDFHYDAQGYLRIDNHDVVQ